MDVSVRKDFRRNILALEDELFASKNQVEFEPRHYFATGIYCRELFIPAGVCLTGKIHKYDCVNIVPFGNIEVATELGRRTVVGPTVFVSPPGTKRAGFAHEDTLWITVHSSKETDLEKLEQELIAQSYDEYLTHVEALRLG